jgi:hypothetical protein
MDNLFVVKPSSEGMGRRFGGSSPALPWTKRKRKSAIVLVRTTYFELLRIGTSGLASSVTQLRPLVCGGSREDVVIVDDQLSLEIVSI